jgi:hypothetical protein
MIELNGIGGTGYIMWGNRTHIQIVDGKYHWKSPFV